MSITYIPPRVPSVEGFLREDGTVPLTGIWDTGNVLIKGPSAIYTSATEPTSPYVGMLWNDTSIASRKMIRSWSGSAWGVVSGYETASRTISLVHDHGALLTNTYITNVWNNEIGKNGSATITIEIDNKTHKTFSAGAAVDAGGGLVKLPLASGHGFVAGERVCIDGTTNYDGVFIVNSVEEAYIIIPATYVAETILATAVVRVVITNVGSFSGNMNPIILKAKSYTAGIWQKQSVVFYNNLGYSRPYFSGLFRESHVIGIKVFTEASIGFQSDSCNSLFYDYCSVSGSTSFSALVASQGGFVRAGSLSVKKASRGLESTYGVNLVSHECVTVSDVAYGLYADYAGTIIKTSAIQPTGSTANEYAVTSRGGQIR